MKTLTFSLLITVLLGCSSIKITSDTTSGADFTKYKSYKVVHYVNEDDLAKKQFNINQINKQRVEKAINAEATSRALSAEDKPELLILWAVGVDVQKSYSTHTSYNGGNYMGYRGRYGGYGMGSSYSTTQETETAVGMLRIALVDTETEEMLWIGIAEGEVKGKSKDAESKVNEVVAKIFAECPIPKK